MLLHVTQKNDSKVKYILK